METENVSRMNRIRNLVGTRPSKANIRKRRPPQPSKPRRLTIRNVRKNFRPVSGTPKARPSLTSLSIYRVASGALDITFVSVAAKTTIRRPVHRPLPGGGSGGRGGNLLAPEFMRERVVTLSAYHFPSSSSSRMIFSIGKLTSSNKFLATSINA